MHLSVITANSVSSRSPAQIISKHADHDADIEYRNDHACDQDGNYD